jgi:hypothetical protein
MCSETNLQTCLCSYFAVLLRCPELVWYPPNVVTNDLTSCLERHVEAFFLFLRHDVAQPYPFFFLRRNVKFVMMFVRQHGGWKD